MGACFPGESLEEGLMGDDSMVASKQGDHVTGCCKWGV